MTTIAESIAALCKRQLADAELTLLALVVDAHATAAVNNAGNASNLAASIYGQTGSPVTASIIAAMLTMGGAHAPAQQARQWLFRRLGDDESAWDSLAAQDVADGAQIPGYGNSFHKDDIDPALEPTAELLMDAWPTAHKRIMAGFNALKAKGPGLFPNLAAYTGAVAEIIDLPEGLESVIVIMPRIPVWASCWAVTPK